MTEADIQRACSDFLAVHGWRRVRTDPVSDRRRGKGFGERGMCDDLYIRYSRNPPHAEVLWVEWKGPRGRVSEHQRQWHRAERARGAMVAVATEDFETTIEDFLRWYKERKL